eukprot:scaffold4719_cov314-Pinguiococcus_pyrenoidosus.AAC.5
MRGKGGLRAELQLLAERGAATFCRCGSSQRKIRSARAPKGVCIAVCTLAIGHASFQAETLKSQQGDKACSQMRKACARTCAADVPHLSFPSQWATSGP